MGKIKSLEELKALRDSVKNTVDVREHGENIEDMIVVRVGMATCGIAAGAREIINFMSNELRKQDIDNVMITQVDCMGLCDLEPTVEVNLKNKEPVIYGNVTKDKVLEIIEQHIKNGVIVEGVIAPEERPSDK